MLSTEEKEVWVRVYCAYIQGRSETPQTLHLGAYQMALMAIEDFQKSFPVKVAGYRESAK